MFFQILSFSFSFSWSYVFLEFYFSYLHFLSLRCFSFEFMFPALFTDYNFVLSSLLFVLILLYSLHFFFKLIFPPILAFQPLFCLPFYLFFISYIYISFLPYFDFISLFFPFLSFNSVFFLPSDFRPYILFHLSGSCPFFSKFTSLNPFPLT